MIVLVVFAWILITGGVSMAGYGLIRAVSGWPGPVAVKTGARARSWDYVWLGGISTAIGLIVVGIESKLHLLTSIVTWTMVAFSVLSILLQIRRRRS
jgi:hypothetical protein